MAFVFDADKDAINRAKHGLSLAQAADVELDVTVQDQRRAYGEIRLRAFGLIDGEPCCLVFTPRGDDIRVISLRRAHWKEYRRHVPE